MPARRARAQQPDSTPPSAAAAGASDDEDNWQLGGEVPVETIGGCETFPYADEDGEDADGDKLTARSLSALKFVWVLDHSPPVIADIDIVSFGPRAAGFLPALGSVV